MRDQIRRCLTLEESEGHQNRSLVRTNGYWYNHATKTLHDVPDYHGELTKDNHDTTDWHGHNAWSSVPGYHKQLGLTAEDSRVFDRVRRDHNVWDDDPTVQVPFKRAYDKLWKGNTRVSVTTHPNRPASVFAQTMGAVRSRDGKLSPEHHKRVGDILFDLRARGHRITKDSSVLHINAEDQDDTDTLASDHGMDH